MIEIDKVIRVENYVENYLHKSNPQLFPHAIETDRYRWLEMKFVFCLRPQSSAQSAPVWPQARVEKKQTSHTAPGPQPCFVNSLLWHANIRATNQVICCLSLVTWTRRRSSWSQWQPWHQFESSFWIIKPARDLVCNRWTFNRRDDAGRQRWDLELRRILTDLSREFPMPILLDVDAEFHPQHKQPSSLQRCASLLVNKSVILFAT